MFHPEVIDRAEVAVSRSLQATLPGGKLLRRSLDERWTMRDQLASAAPKKKGEPASRALTSAESDFITHELLLAKLDYRYWSDAWCNTPDAPIWMGDLSFKALGDVRVGDSVVGWARLPVRHQKTHANRAAPRRVCVLRERHVTTTVKAIARRRAPVVAVHLASGRTIRCTPDHWWSNGVPQYRAHRPWIHAEPGQFLRSIVLPSAAPTDPDLVRLCGWLGGMYDGEGSLRTITQCADRNPETWRELCRVLRLLGFDFTVSAATASHVTTASIVGGRSAYTRFLNYVQPVKRTKLADHILGTSDSVPDQILAVESAGESEVISMETGTGNYVAWGYGSKNCIITKEDQNSAPIHPRWASQQLFLDHVAAMEIDQFRAGSQNGVLVNVGKARQLGLSTELEVIMAHGATTQTALRGLVAADVEDQSKYLFSLFEGIVKELPWWLLPTLGAYDTGRFWSTLTNRTEVRTAWGKSSRGGLADDAKAKGNIGRGKTFGRVHLSELSTWEKPDQIDDGLIPAIPRRPRSFAGFESTAKGRHDWWHTHWTATARGKTRFRNIFIPWYVEPEKYWAVPTSLTWQPDAGTLAHAVAVERESPEWLFGKTIRLTREQLAWYEQTRDMYTEKGDLYKFYEEYPATPAEMFQYSGRSVFTAATLEAVRRQESAPRILKIEPAKDIATLRAWERSDEGRSGAPRP